MIEGMCQLYSADLVSKEADDILGGLEAAGDGGDVLGAERADLLGVFV